MRSRLIFVCLYRKEYIHAQFTHTHTHTHTKYFDFKGTVIIKLFIFYETIKIKSIKQGQF